MSENNLGDDDEREILKSINNDASAFRVAVDLQRYFKDNRARCYLMVASKGYVRYLEQRIKTIFALPGPFCLCTDGYLLPSSEPLALLAPGDVIEVVPLEETQESSPPAVHVKEEKEAPHQENSRTAVDGRMNDPYFLELYARRRQTLEALRIEHRFLLNMDLLRTERAEAPPRRVRWGTRSPEPRAAPQRDQP